MPSARGSRPRLSSDSDVKDSLKQFTDVYSVIEDNYAEPVNPDKAIYNGAIPGMLHALDPHSNFFDPKSYALMREDQRGKYYGVGMTVGPRNNKVIVIFPFTGTPAYKAGIHPGDVIIAVDGKSTENMSTSDVADLLKGPKGTTVHISISREGVEKPMEFTPGPRRDSALQRRRALPDPAGYWLHARDRIQRDDRRRSLEGAG